MKKVVGLKTKGNTAYLCPEDTEANADWLRSTRLLKAGDKKALKKLERMKKTPMYRVEKED